MSVKYSWISQLSLVLLVCPAVAQAQGQISGNLMGQRGVLRLEAATPHPAGWMALSTDLQFFSASNFLQENRDHSRLINSYVFSWAPLRLMEAALALHVITDNNTASVGDELQVAVGDPELSVKVGSNLGSEWSVGGLLDLRFPSAAGFFEASAGATNLFLALLGSWSPSGRYPLGVHLNLGFLRDGSENLFDNVSKLTDAQRYSAQISSFDRWVTRIAWDMATQYVGPFVELSLEKYLGDGAPGFGDSPGILSFGAKVWPTKKQGLQLLAALDLGLTGVANAKPVVEATTGKYAFPIPRWNILFQLSYRFEPFAEPEIRYLKTGVSPQVRPPLPPPTKMGIIEGKVLDSRSDKPIWNARITIEGEDNTGLAVNSKDGAFRSYRLPVGKKTVMALADGYSPMKLDLNVLPEGKTEATFKLTPKLVVVPGTLRGTIKALSGNPPASSTVLIPELDQTIKVGSEGTFNLSLKPGEYKIVVSAPGFRTQTKAINITEGSTVILNVELYRK